MVEADATSSPLARAAALVRSLSPNRRDAAAFYERRSEALACIRAAARPKPRRRRAGPDPRQAALPLP